MFGTVARIRLNDGMEQTLIERLAGRSGQIPGYVAGYLYRLENEVSTYLLTVVFASKDEYLANAESPEQREHFRSLRETMAAEPEWQDGEIVYAHG